MGPLSPHATVTGDHVLELVTRAQLALGFSQRQVAEAVGTSLRTVQRWSSRTAHPHVGELRALAVLVHPRDAGLASKLATVAGDTLESLGLVKPPPPPAVVEPAASVARALPANITSALADSVVAAAAEVLDVSPRVARPALLAAMRRAKSTELDLDSLLSALEPAKPPAPKRPKRTPRS